MFGEKMKSYLDEASAVNDCRHGTVVYMAKAISVRDKKSLKCALRMYTI